MNIIFVAPQHMTSILTLGPKTPTIKVVVSLEPLVPEERKIYETWGQQLGIKIMDLPEREYSLSQFFDVFLKRTKQWRLLARRH